MMWFKRILRRWVFEAETGVGKNPTIQDAVLASTTSSGLMEGENAQVRVSLRPAVNGKILEVGKYKPNPRGPDWSFEHYIIPEGEDITHWVTTALVSGRLER